MTTQNMVEDVYIITMGQKLHKSPALAQVRHFWTPVHLWTHVEWCCTLRPTDAHLKRAEKVVSQISSLPVCALLLTWRQHVFHVKARLKRPSPAQVPRTFSVWNQSTFKTRLVPFKESSWAKCFSPKRLSGRCFIQRDLTSFPASVTARRRFW